MLEGKRVDVSDFYIAIEDDNGEIKELRPLYKEPDETDTKSTEDMLVSLSKEVANLKREITDLRNQNNDLTNNIRKFAETAEQAEYKADQALELDEKIEMCIDDIAMLDERTQELNDDGLAELGAEILRIIERRKRYGRQFY